VRETTGFRAHVAVEKSAAALRERFEWIKERLRRKLLEEDGDA
jgi:hypothetical protein